VEDYVLRHGWCSDADIWIRADYAFTLWWRQDEVARYGVVGCPGDADKEAGKRARTKVQTMRKVMSGEIVECCSAMGRLRWWVAVRGGVDVRVYSGRFRRGGFVSAASLFIPAIYDLYPLILK
jgi:hypothetical protein